MLLLDESESFADESHSASFSSQNEAQGGDLREWQCIPPPSTSPAGGTPAKPPPSQPTSRPHSGVASQRPTPSSTLTENRKRSSKASHMRRNIRKLLREHQLEAVTQSAQQEELQRRRRLNDQRKQDFPIPPLPECGTGDVTKHVSSTSSSPQQEGGITQDSSSTFRDVKTDICASNKAGTINLSRCDDNAVSRDHDIEREPSGMHVNDDFNRPDDQARVLVNVNHPATEEDIFLSPQLARAVKPHQIGGIRFLYDNLVESLERFGSSSGFGCVLAHSMGLGKTLQVISFIDVLFRYTKAHTVLAIVPVNTLQNWLAEFNMWVPDAEALTPNSNNGPVRPRTFKVHILNDEHKNTASRAKVVESWAQDGGVLLMGYEMYRLLSLKKNLFSGRKKKSKKTAGPAVINLDEEDRQQKLLKAVERALARPGPDVVICDEGHRIKNCHASTSQALKNIRTKRRVVLTGYPLQNNLIEYWCMVDFVRPDFLGTRQEFSNMFERPILNGQCVDSTPQDIQLMRYRSHVLHSLLEGFVQRRGHDVLKDHLPSKEEHVILVRLSPLQRALYTEFMTRFREAGNTGWLSLNPLKAFCVCCKIWNHPDVLYEALQKENLASDQDLDLDDITSATPTRCPSAVNQKAKVLENPTPIGGLSLNQLQDKANQVITYEWAKDIMCDYKPGILENSPKMVLLFHLIEESVRKGDKILVFSQSLSTLTVIEDFLAKRPVPCPGKTSSQEPLGQNWVRNLNYYRLDGSTTTSERERLINQFNDPNNTSAFLFLLSTRAGCLGVNLVGANRVVVFDASWNPCHDAQAVCRVYRYGQRKPCHVYRLVCDFTLEKKIYDRQISKQGMSDRVVDDLNPVLNFTRREVESLLHFAEEEPELRQVKLQPQESIDSVLGKALHLFSHLITKQPFPHESLLMDRRELKLSTAEKKEAKKGYEEEKRASVPYTRPSYAHYYPASDQSLTNIPAFSQRNWRPPHTKEKPVVSSGPDQSAPVPSVPRQGSAGSTPTSKDSSASALGGFPVNCLQKAGVFVQKIVTTTDMVIPGTNSSTDVKARITAGESIHVIRGSKGTYIRTSDGRIFAIRAANKAKISDETTASQHKDPQGSTDEQQTPGTNGCPSPKRQQAVTPDALLRSLSPDGPEIIGELQRYAASKGRQPARDESCEENESYRGAKRSRVIPPNTDAQDLRISSKRKASSPSPDEWSSKRSQGFPYYGLPLGFHPGLLAGSLGQQSLYMGAGSPLFHPSHPILGDSNFTPEMFASSSSSTFADVSSSSSQPSSVSKALAPGPLPPFMLSPSLAGMAGMLPPSLALSYSQSMASLYRRSTLPDPAATPGSAGASFLSQYAPTTGSGASSSSSSPSSFSHSEDRAIANGRSVSSPSSSGDSEEVVEANGL
ncbi:helicase ARIP4-like isoform X1 [Corythoichthys intestinalis]|uniref:helicase ARIP4-like isoform X1 n=1 Tax=Corythoichthys intestinalis TaxID=161448 RepID=UPI0025A5B983|nr:helicase ARIP4-like isoform X1 [Corythoichthys intestinalis]